MNFYTAFGVVLVVTVALGGACGQGADGEPESTQEPEAAGRIESMVFGGLRSCRDDSACGGALCYRGVCAGLMDTDAVWLQHEVGDRLLSRIANDPAARSELIGLLEQIVAGSDRAPLMRSRLVSFLGRVEGDEPLAILRRATKDAALPVRMRALLALGERGDASVYDELRPLLDDPSEAIRAQLAHALGGIGTAQALERLVELATNDGSPQVRIAAVRAMGDAGADAARGALLDVLTQGPGYLHYDATVALRRLTGKDIGVDPQAWKAAIEGSSD